MNAEAKCDHPTGGVKQNGGDRRGGEKGFRLNGSTSEDGNAVPHGPIPTESLDYILTDGCPVLQKRRAKNIRAHPNPTRVLSPTFKGNTIRL